MGGIYLLSMKLSGMKSIENEVVLQFYKQTIGKTFDPDRYHVKAIYGENGTGKTAILYAMDIVKNIVLDDYYLLQKENQVLLNELINKKTRRFHFECEFLDFMNDHQDVYKYEITLSQNQKHNYVIEDEACSVRKAYANNEGKTLFRVTNQDLQTVHLMGVIKDEVIKETSNLHDYHSMVIKSLDYFVRQNVKEKIDDLKDQEARYALNYFTGIRTLEAFFKSVHVYLDHKEGHQTYSFHHAIYKGLDKGNDFTKENETFIVLKESMDAFEEYVYRLKKFIGVFKTDLENIEIIKRDAQNHFVCELIFCYKDYELNYAYESAGMKRMISLYNGLNLADEGDIVLIDDIDLHVNTVGLDVIIDYFRRYGRGQLIFTLHTTSPMNVLKHNKKAIDFITDVGIVSWVSKGNASPENYYRNGMIDGIPFNIEPEDFLGIFGDDE